MFSQWISAKETREFSWHKLQIHNGRPEGSTCGAQMFTQWTSSRSRVPDKVADWSERGEGTEGEAVAEGEAEAEAEQEERMQN